MAGRCYVYLIKNGDVPLYVGKGTSGRGKVSARRHGGELHILEDGLSDDQAFKSERKWIAELCPTENICPGGNGGRSKPKRKPRRTADEIEMDRVGTRVFSARILCAKLDFSNCEEWGVSKVDMSRLMEVAHG